MYRFYKRLILLSVLVSAGFLFSADGQVFPPSRPEAAQEKVPWISGRAISPSISYQYRVEQRPDYHQQIHRVRIDLRGENLVVRAAPSTGFPFKTEYPADIFKREKAQIVVPASLFTQTKNGRCVPLGGLVLPGMVFTKDSGLPQIEMRPLNRIVFKQTGLPSAPAPRIEFDKEGIFELSGMNIPPTGPGLYLFTRPFAPISEKELAQWGAKDCFYLEKSVNSPDPCLFWVRKAGKASQSVYIPENNCLLLDTRDGKQTPADFLTYRREVRILPDGEEANSLIENSFCGGPYFLHEGKYDDAAVKTFCAIPGAPPISQYTERKARLALALDESQRILNIYAVDMKGFTREGMALREFAEFLAGEGIQEAIALPDGDMASLILPDGQVNSTDAGIDAPVLSAFVVTERASEKGAPLNLLRTAPNMITACGAEPLNPADAIRDGSYNQVPMLDNYWEHIDKDPFHKHAIQIDLMKPYDLAGAELFYAGEAGFSEQYNWRAFTIYGDEREKTSLRKIMEVANPEGRSCQRISFPPGTRLRYIKIEIDKPGLFPESGAARLAELVLLGRPE